LTNSRFYPGYSVIADDLGEDAVAASEEQIKAAIAAVCPRPPCAVCGRPRVFVHAYAHGRLEPPPSPDSCELGTT
jgi:hypothetical protein